MSNFDFADRRPYRSRRADRMVVFIVICLGISCVGIGVIIAVLVSKKEQKADSKPDPLAALLDKPRGKTLKELNADLVKHFEDRIVDFLISPSTAKFSSGRGSWDGEIFTANGTIDAQNKFGAMLRSSWLVAYNKSAKGGQGCISKIWLGNGDICTLGRLSFRYGLDGEMLRD